MRKKPIIVSVAVVVLLIVLVGVIGGYILYRKITMPKDIIKGGPEMVEGLEEWCPGTMAWITPNLENGNLKDTTVVFDDGCALHSYYIAAKEPSRKTAVLVHGWTASPYAMMMFARFYRDEFGYNVWVPAMRGHEKSEGHIQMGWKDRKDVLKWSEIAHEVFSDTLQVIHGVSMGGATVMMLSGDPTPDYIKGFIEDCGYTDVWNQLTSVLHSLCLPVFPIQYCADAYCRSFEGWNFREASAAGQLPEAEKPMLFIHGLQDEFVPTEMVYANYDAKTNGYKELWTPDAPHARSYNEHPAEYVELVGAFLKNHVE